VSEPSAPSQDGIGDEKGDKKRGGTSTPYWGSNGLSLAVEDVPHFSTSDFRDECVRLCSRGSRLVALCALPSSANSPKSKEGRAGDTGILAVLADDATGQLGFLQTDVGAKREYPALTEQLPQAQAFERELFESHGIKPQGHPWLKPLRLHDSVERHTPGYSDEASQYPFLSVEGAGIHEVAVGPVHAGIIEPGHFRFQCHGERVLSLEIQHGYQHRGVEPLLLQSSPARRLVVAESIAGDTAVGHATAYCMVMEALAEISLPLAAKVVRGVALELERLANHIGDLGALCGDIAYLAGASVFGRLRGNFLNALLEISGNRHGRGLLTVGGVRSGIDVSSRGALLDRIARDEIEFKKMAASVFDVPSILARFEHTGIVSRETAQNLGLVGPAARASGVARDVRRDHPTGIYRFAHIPVAEASDGDVMARAVTRWIEARRSLTFVQERLSKSEDGSLRADVGSYRPRRLVVSLVEGWRGEIAHIGVTDTEGALCGYKIVDPSFHNWFGLAMAIRGNEISDFPVCNKSFNLSYAGHDL